MEEEFCRFIETILQKKGISTYYNIYLINLFGPQGTRVHYVVLENSCIYVYHHYLWMASDMSIYRIGSEQENDSSIINNVALQAHLPINPGNTQDILLNMQSIIERLLAYVTSDEQCVRISKDYSLEFPRDFLVPQFLYNYVNTTNLLSEKLDYQPTIKDKETISNLYRVNKQVNLGPKLREI